MLGFSDNHSRNVAAVVEALSERGVVTTEVRRIALHLHNLQKEHLGLGCTDAPFARNSRELRARRGQPL